MDHASKLSRVVWCALARVGALWPALDRGRERTKNLPNESCCGVGGGAKDRIGGYKNSFCCSWFKTNRAVCCGVVGSGEQRVGRARVGTKKFPNESWCGVMRGAVHWLGWQREGVGKKIHFWIMVLN